MTPDAAGRPEKCSVCGCQPYVCPHCSGEATRLRAEVEALREALETVATLYENGGDSMIAYDMRCVARSALLAARKGDEG